MKNIQKENTFPTLLGEKTDTRIIRSKIAIKQAFIMLIETKGYESITIKEISEKALVNRKTFYAHYETKEYLHKEVINDAINLLEIEKIAAIAFSIQNRNQLKAFISNVFTNIFTLVKINRRMFIALFDDPTSTALQDRFEEVLHKEVLVKTLEGMGNRNLELPPELTHTIIVTIALSTLKWWIRQEEVSLEDAVKMMVFTFDNDLLSLLGFN